MIVIDANIISTFCRVNKLKLLFQLLPEEQFGVASAVYDEIHEAILYGYKFLEKANSFIESGKLHLLPMSQDELLFSSIPFPLILDEEIWRASP